MFQPVLKSRSATQGPLCHTRQNRLQPFNLFGSGGHWATGRRAKRDPLLRVPAFSVNGIFQINVSAGTLSSGGGGGFILQAHDELQRTAAPSLRWGLALALKG